MEHMHVLMVCVMIHSAASGMVNCNCEFSLRLVRHLRLR